jgi:hypothetical protein
MQTAAADSRRSSPRPLPRAGDTPSLDLVEVITWSTERLERAMREGATPDPEDIAGWEWRGYNVPFFTQVLGFRKFKKAFYYQSGELRGYNVKIVQQGGPTGPWIPQRDKHGRDAHHGFYDVVAPRAPDDVHPNSLLIDYDCGRNPVWDPSSRLRDYIVQLGPDLLLGVAYGALTKRRRIGPISYFVLQRNNEVG